MGDKSLNDPEENKYKVSDKISNLQIDHRSIVIGIGIPVGATALFSFTMKQK